MSNNEDDIRLKNKQLLAVLRTQLIHQVKQTEFYKETREGLLKHMKQFPDNAKYCVIYFDFDDLNVFYNDIHVVRDISDNRIVLDKVVETQSGLEIEAREYD